ncbi:hypothetical protein [Novosphingobium sp. KA1]|uniref:hypothetical protein n=1 Tax=Novosphingobium sp. (strain KA1) TaxID=164608 RepID=UPI001A8C53C7|nr:hypothetical protein [Novosphingobium sp. KA1]QSR16040.1 hypothetical protein CA833_02315 [Novosphingobium sp. KA1]
MSVALNTPAAQKQYEALHREAGEVLSFWMNVEVQAQQTFCAALEARNGAAMKAVFRAAINANARLSMTNEAVTHCLEEIAAAELLDEWNSLYARARKLARRRNAVAHSQAVIVMGKPKGGVASAVGARLVDPLEDGEFPPNPSKLLVEGISVEQLVEMKGRFHSLAFDLQTHREKIYVAQKQFRASPAQ